MYITVKEALALPSMEKAKILAGKNGLYRRITSVNIMEVPEIADFVKPGELIITTMYPIQDKKEIQKTLISELVSKDVSVLVIVPLSKEKKIPSFMIDEANKYDFPLIQLPINTSFNEILNSILEKVLERKNIKIESKSRARIIDDLLNDKVIEKSEVLSLGKYYGWDLSHSFTPVMLKFNSKEYYESYYLLANKLSVIAGKQGESNTIAVEREDGIFALFPQNDPVTTNSKMYKILKQFSKDINNIYIGIGCAIQDIMDINIGYMQAKQAVEIAQRVDIFGKIVDFKTLGIYRVLIDLPDTTQNIINKRNFVKEKLGPIIEHDKLHNTELMHTLQVLFEQNGNLRKTARKLFLHYNTVSYRLNQIEDITKLDLSDPETKLELQIAIKLNFLL